MKKFSFLLPFIPFIILAIFYLIIVPIGQTLDEPAHLSYISYIVNHLSLPDYSGSGVAHHPPFYYLILSPFYYVSSIDQISRLICKFVFKSKLGLLCLALRTTFVVEYC